MENYDSQMAMNLITQLLVDWRFYSMDYGELCVAEILMKLMLLLLAGSLGMTMLPGYFSSKLLLEVTIM